MTEDQFWDMIERSRAGQSTQPGFLKKLFGGRKPANQNAQFLESLRTQLNAAQPADVKDFKIILGRELSRAYTWELWAAAYIMMGGCSDDGFEYWRAWLISQGRDTFNAAAGNPESLAASNFGSPDEMELEELLYLAPEIYESKTGSDLYEQLPKLNGPTEPTGDRWDEDSSVLQAKFPKLWAKYN